MHGLKKIFGKHPHHPHEIPPHHDFPHGVPPQHDSLLHHIIHNRPKHRIIQNIKVNVNQQPQNQNQNQYQYQYNDNYQQPYYEKEGTNQGQENRPMSTDDYFNLKNQIEEDYRRKEWEKLKKKDKKENITEKEKEEEKEINLENNYPQQSSKNSNQEAQYNQSFEPAPPSNQTQEMD